jgi:hypothetical protein
LPPPPPLHLDSRDRQGGRGALVGHDQEVGKGAGRRPSSPRSHRSHVPVLLLIIVLAALATLLWYRVLLGKYDQGLHDSVTEHLQALFPTATVQVGRVSADGPGQIVVNNVRFATAVGRGKRPVVTIHRAVLQGELDIANWLRKTTRVRHIELHGVRVEVWRQRHGGWSVQAMQPQPNSAHPTPTMNFDDVTVRLHSDDTLQAQVVSVQDLHGRIEPQYPLNSLAAAHTDDGRPWMDLGLAQPQQAPLDTPPVSVQLSCRGTGVVKSLALAGQVDVQRQTWSADGSLEGLNFSPLLMESLPAELAQTLSQLSGLECVASSRFKISSTPQQPITFEVQGQIASGRWRDARLPYPLDNLSGDFFCKNQILQLRSMRASSGDADFELSCDIMGFGPDVPMVIHATAYNLDIDGRLRESLPEGLQTQWDRLRPAGRVSGNLQLTFDGQSWTPIASIRCEQVSITPWLFPYPLSHIEGLIHYQDRTLSTDQLTGLAGGQIVTGQFSLSQLGSEWYGRLSGRAAGPIAIDQTLLTALTPEGKPDSGAERFLRSLQPRGAVQLTFASFEKKSPDDPSWNRKIDLNVLGASIQYEHFRYPIYEIQGRIAGQDDNWWLHQFEGRNDSGLIVCSGNWHSVSDGPVPFDLRFEATAVPIEEELRRALSNEVQMVWDELQPSGSIDRVEVRLTKRSSEPMTTGVTIVEQSQSNQVTGRSLRIQPKNFPVQLTDIDCHIQYEPGRVLIHNASGVNGDNRLSIHGACQPRPDGRWLADIQWLPSTRFMVDSQLLRALPKAIRDSLVRIDFRGPVAVVGGSHVLFANNAQSKIETAWNCQLDVENGQFGDGKTIGGLRGTVLATGASDGNALKAAGSVQLDALNVMGIPLTKLNGPYSIADNILAFGSEVRDLQGNRSSQEMTADALTGRLVLAGVANLTNGKLILNAKLEQAELSGLLRDVGVERASTQARCDAQLNFSGVPWDSQAWAGDGEIHLTDARLFQLPFMMRLLGTAAVNPEDDSAFQTADIRFEIDGDKIPLQVSCEGDVLRLRGDGSVNLRRELDLDLYSYVGRRPIYSVVSPLLSESRYATFMLIEVSGTLDNPVMQRRPFPQIEATLQQIFPEVANSEKTGNLIPWRK